MNVKGSLLLSDIVSTTWKDPWKDLVGKMVSKLRSIAELRAFYGRLLISSIDNKLRLILLCSDGSNSSTSTTTNNMLCRDEISPALTPPSKKLKTEPDGEYQCCTDFYYFLTLFDFYL